MHDKEEIARHYGFRSPAELLAISTPLPMRPGDTVQSYLARDLGGNWFVWEDVPPPVPKTPPDDP